MKRIALSAVVLALAVGFVVLAGGASNGSAAGTYKIELDNAFGLVKGENFKVAGVVAGTITNISLDPKNLHAVITVQDNEGGFGSFRSNAFCESRPQSLIGEYYIDCDPGTSKKVLKPGSTIPVTQTTSTIPADVVDDIMRMPYRQRFAVLINELGAGVAGQSGDLQAALDRAVPALTETDNLLHLLANDSQTLKSLTQSSDTVITALANNSKQVQRFVVEADNTASDTATQDANLRLTFQNFPGFLEQLRPALQKLDTATSTNEPVLANLRAASGQIDRLFTDLPSFSRSARPAISSLGQASVTGRSAVQAAGPTITDLNQFAKHTPELAKNLSIVLPSLDTQSNAVEPDSRSPGGKGFSGLEALLGYVFNQALAINAFGPYGHQLTVDAFVDTKCTPYATPATIASSLKTFGAKYRSCYSWLGPNQPGVNEKDPSDPSAAVPDPGGAPPGEAGPATDASKLEPVSDALSRDTRHKAHGKHSAPGHGSRSRAHPSPAGQPATGPSGTASAGNGQSASGTTSSPSPTAGLGKTVGTILGVLAGRTSAHSSSPGSSTGSSSSGGSSQGSQTEQLLNYLLSP